MIWGGWAVEGSSMKIERPKQSYRKISHGGSTCQKYVYSSFIVKINFKFGSFVNLFGSRMMWEFECQVWIFGLLRAKSSNFWGQWILDFTVQSGWYLRKYKYLMKDIYWWKVYIYQVLDWCHLLFIFKHFVHGSGVGLKFGIKNGIFGKCSKRY